MRREKSKNKREVLEGDQGTGAHWRMSHPNMNREMNKYIKSCSLGQGLPVCVREAALKPVYRGRHDVSCRTSSRDIQPSACGSGWSPLCWLWLCVFTVEAGCLLSWRRTQVEPWVQILQNVRDIPSLESSFLFWHGSNSHSVHFVHAHGPCIPGRWWLLSCSTRWPVKFSFKRLLAKMAPVDPDPWQACQKICFSNANVCCAVGPHGTSLAFTLAPFLLN